MTKFPWELKYMAKYILKAFFLTTFPSTQKKCPKIYAVILVLPLKGSSEGLAYTNPIRRALAKFLEWHSKEGPKISTRTVTQF